MQGKQMRYTDAELLKLKSMFGDEESLKLLRKFFLPEISPDAPIGQNVDLWMTMKIEDLDAEQALVNLKARNNLIAHVESCLLTIYTLVGRKNETVEETKNRLLNNSSK